MTARHLLAAVLLLSAPGAARAEEEPPLVTAERVREILSAAGPHVSRLTGLAWPTDLVVERTDPAGLETILREEFEEQVATLSPERSAASRRHLAGVLARSFARILRAKYGLRTKRIHVAPGALARLPEKTDPDQALTWLVVHEAVHAVDDRAVDIAKALAAANDGEARRALRMVIEGRAEHYGAEVALLMGVRPAVGDVFAAGRDPGERLTREGGRRFIAALEKRDKALPLEALRAPPTSTSIVFHPERYASGDSPPDVRSPLAATLPGHAPETLSELLLRKRFAKKGKPAEVEVLFAGFLAGAAVQAKDGRRVSLVALSDEESAERFREGLLAFAPDDPRFAWAAVARGRWVAEALVPKGEDPRELAGKALAAAGEKED